MQPGAPRFLQGWQLVGAVALVLVSSAIATVLWHQGSVDGVRLVIRFTARTSLVLFSLAFSASALHRLWPNGWTRWQRSNRRYLGVSFAVSHGVHAVAIASFALLDPRLFHELVPTRNLIFGGLAYLFIIAMTATSFDRAAAWIGPRAWKILHTAGAYYVWLIFLQAVAKRAVLDQFYWPLTAVVVGAMALRVAAALSRGGAVAARDGKATP